MHPPAASRTMEETLGRGATAQFLLPPGLICRQGLRFEPGQTSLLLEAEHFSGLKPLLLCKDGKRGSDLLPYHPAHLTILGADSCYQRNGYSIRPSTFFEARRLPEQYP